MLLSQPIGSRLSRKKAMFQDKKEGPGEGEMAQPLNGLHYTGSVCTPDISEI
jgi:hypothetical protein